jgi:hypothetical protein
VTSFLPVPVDGGEAKGHGEVAKWYQVPVDSCEVSCHDEIVSVRAKNPPDRTMTKSSALALYFGRSGGQGTSASARQPNRSVPGDETVRVQ